MYSRRGPGWLGTETFWRDVKKNLAMIRQYHHDQSVAQKYLPHIIHFYAKSREAAQRYPIPLDFEEAIHTKYYLQRVIDEWNRKTYLQTYWDPPMEGDLMKWRWGYILKDGYCKTVQAVETEPEEDGSSSKLRKLKSPVSPVAQLSMESTALSPHILSLSNSSVAYINDDNDIKSGGELIKYNDSEKNTDQIRPSVSSESSRISPKRREEDTRLMIRFRRFKNKLVGNWNKGGLVFRSLRK